MNLDLMFFINSILLGAGLAMDAFSVSLANGLNESHMKIGRQSLISMIFALFQFAMPMIGWFCVSTITCLFCQFEKYIPWIALILLCYIGGKMLYEGIKNEKQEEVSSLNMAILMIQGIATSIDALSVGFTISSYHFIEALIACLIIGLVTYVICFIGVSIGKKAGTTLSGKAGMLGGVILIFIGLEIFIKSFI